MAKWKYVVEIESEDDVDFSQAEVKRIIEESYDDFNDGTKISAIVTPV